VWTPPDIPLVEPMKYFAYKVPDDPNVASIQLVGPGGVLAKSKFSAHPPTVSITSPADGASVTPVAGAVHIAWTGSDADHNPLVYSVLYSSDGGQTFVAQSFEQTATSFTLPLAAVHDHQVQILVSDGTRSSQATVHFATP
jgi:hypothetical protein